MAKSFKKFHEDRIDEWNDYDYDEDRQDKDRRLAERRDNKRKKLGERFKKDEENG